MLFFIPVWIAIALGIALYARRSGLRFGTYFLISLFFSPLVGVIVFAIERHEKPARRTSASQSRPVSSPPSASSPGPASP